MNNNWHKKIRAKGWNWEPYYKNIRKKLNNIMEEENKVEEESEDLDQMKKYPCIESTLEIQDFDKVIRLWIDEEEVELNLKRGKKISDFIQDYLERINHDYKSHELADWVHKNIPKINAIQVIDHNFDSNESRYGMVYYLVDFEEDVHGQAHKETERIRKRFR